MPLFGSSSSGPEKRNKGKNKGGFNSSRNELFEGARGRDPANMPEQQLSVDQLVQKAERTHKDTTATTRNALRTVEQSKQVQAATLEEFRDQGDQLHRVNNKLYQMNEDLSYGEKLLRYMNRWCCCMFFDKCTGADPERNVRDEWKDDVDQGRTAARDHYYTDRELIPQHKDGPVDNLFKGPKNGFKGFAGGANGVQNGDGFRDPYIQLDDAHRAEELRLHEETRKQNEMLEQIHDGLGELMQGARRMGEEADNQGHGLDTLHSRAETTVGRIQDVNNKSQLRKFDVDERGRPYHKAEGSTSRLWSNLDDQSLSNKIKMFI